MAFEERSDEVATRQGMYRTRLIYSGKRMIPIVLQNNNGPSPLVAICNVLQLKDYSKLNVKMETGEISEFELSSLLGDLLLNSAEDTSEEFDLISKLATMIDVHVKFTRIDAFESTPGSRIFELLKIPLYHGWIVNPQDDDTYNAIGDASYKTLLALLTTWPRLKKGDTEEQGMLDEALIRSQMENLDPNYNLANRTIGESNASSYPRNIDEPISNQTGAEFDSSSGRSTRQEPDASSYPRNIDEPTGNQTGAEFDSSSGRSTHQEPDASPTSPDGSEDTYCEEEYESDSEDTDYEALQEAMYEQSLADKDPLDGSDSRGFKEDPVRLQEIASAELFKDFLKTNESQLTAYGLSCLKNDLKEREICVFFRNKEFRTMLKLRGELYLLVTDVNNPDGWEKLNAVNGATSFVGTLLFEDATNDNPIDPSSHVDFDYQVALALQQREDQPYGRSSSSSSTDTGLQHQGSTQDPPT